MMTNTARAPSSAPVPGSAVDGVAAASSTVTFEAFYASGADRVYRALAVTLGDAHLAKEATDEAMARAYLHWDKVETLDNPGGWAFRVGLNWATSWRRKLRRERPMPADGRRLPVAVPGEDEGAVTAALRRLPVPQRTVVVCRVLLDLSTADTAAVLGLPEGTVQSRLSRALAALRVDLTTVADDEGRKPA